VPVPQKLGGSSPSLGVVRDDSYPVRTEDEMLGMTGPVRSTTIMFGHD
jgi:hypothetical protein